METSVSKVAKTELARRTLYRDPIPASWRFERRMECRSHPTNWNAALRLLLSDRRHVHRLPNCELARSSPSAKPSSHCRSCGSGHPCIGGGNEKRGSHERHPRGGGAVSAQGGRQGGELREDRSVREQAAEKGVEILAFPEMCITGYWHVRNLSREEVDALAEPIPDGPSTQRLLALVGETSA